MKRLYLVRHAKANSIDIEMPDFDRPLTKRGEKDVPMMGGRLAARKVRPDGILTSGALRALTTAKMMAEAIGFAAERIVVDNRIYEADAGDLLGLIQGVDQGWESVMLFGHNPAMTDLVNALTDEFIENVPTCGIATIDVDCDAWAEVVVGTGRLAAFDFPKFGD